ncbi:hypothetical protein CTI14_34300 [Methylobacterium radiotolerans]|nr:hypothetical protein CTI14_34300 [Methylobacterium radiotolerans]
METGLVFLSTMYLQHILRLDSFVTGLIIGLTGVGAVAGASSGPASSQGSVSVARCFAASESQTLATGGLIFIGYSPESIAVYCIVGFIAAIGHMIAIVTSS